MPKPRITYEITAEDKSRAVVDKLESNLKRAAKIGVASVATAATAAAGGLALLTRRAVSAADEIGKLSTQLGIGSKALSEYQFIAEQTGVKFEQFAISLQRQGRRVAEAAQGTGEARAAIDELGLSAQRLNQLDPGAQFEILARQMLKVTNETDQLRLAFKLWDSEGVRNLRTIKETGGEFDALRNRARELGAVVTDDLTEKAENVNNAMGEIKTALSGVGNSLLNTYGPSIVSAANATVAFINRVRRAAEEIGLLDTRLDQLALDELNQKWRENNRQIFLLEERIKLAASGDADRLRERVAGLNQENDKIREQIALIREQQSAGEQVGTVSSDVFTNAGALNPPSLPSAQKSEDEFQRYLESLYSEEQALANSYLKRLEIIEANTVAGSSLQEELKAKEQARLEAQLLEHQAKLGKIEAQGILARRKFEEQNYRQRTKSILGHVLQLTDGVAQSNKTLFKINKIAAIANAVIDAYRGISLTLASYPYPINIGMAALHGAAAFAQISAIKNTSFSGGGGGTTPSLAGSAPVINDVPVITAPVLDDGLATAPASNVINISFNPGISDTEAVRTFITEDLSDALRDGAGIDVRVVAQ